jgi:hypothetical protein
MNGLPKETLDRMVALVQAADGAQPMGVEDPRKAWFHVDAHTESVDIPPPLRHSNVASLTAIIELAEAAIDGVPMAPRPTVWHSHEGVVLLLDDTDRRDTATFPLSQSRPFAALVDLEAEPRWMQQREFCSFLRFVLGVPAQTVAPWRRLEWTNAKASEGETGPGRDRIGRDIRGAVTAGGAELPEDLIVHVPVYREQGERSAYDVRCSIDVDVFGERIALQPLAGEIETVIDEAQASIRERLDAALDGIPIFYGSP